MPNEFSVLIVEDNDDARRNMEDILSLDGYQIRTASHCLPAIEAVESESFDAVIVDWRLPDQNADQLIPIIIKCQPNTPVVVVTGLRDFDTAVTALRSGAYDFLIKPINADALRGVLSRIVERKKHLEAIKRVQDQLLMNERLAAIGQMVTGLAHESRNAFQRSHACLAELALDLGEMPESLKLVYNVQKALDDLNHLLEEVRNYSAPIILDRSDCCFESLARETWEQIREAGNVSADQEMSIEKTDVFPEQCFLDRQRMQQVLRNLLENALFANGGEADVQVQLLRSDQDRSLVRITVTDNGAGVAEEDREAIFTPFFTTKTKGTGLGLALCRRYVDAHQGRIFVDPSYSPGARFVIEMPFRRH